MKIGFAIAISLICLNAWAQDSTSNGSKPVSLSAYVEPYYSYDFNKPSDNNRPSFLYSHNRHNEFNVNLAFLKGSYNLERVRANLALGVGTYMNANYANETGVLRNIYEANAGLKVLKDRNLWLDVGIFSSHIGFESAQSSSCWTLTRSLMAENSPYYEAGAKLTYTSANDKFTVAALALNGWQRITRVSGNSLMSWGTQLTVKPASNIVLNYSNFLGTDKPDSARLWRIYHDLYAIFQLSQKFGVTVGFDIGTEQVTKGSKDKNNWYTTVAILRFSPDSYWAFALRGEYYSDEKGVIVVTGTPNGFKTAGFSLNVDRTISPNFLWRIEFRNFNSKDAIFVEGTSTQNNNAAITMSLAISF